jgi:N-acetylmuramoyl-L-alanine amidase
MFAQRSRIKQATRNILALLGIFLMIASFVWMQRAPRPESAKRSTTAQTVPTSEPFAVVVLDPGHGGQDSGAMCGGVLEKDLTLDVARRIDRWKRKGLRR